MGSEPLFHSGYVIRRASGELVGPFSEEHEAVHYLRPGDEIVRVGKHGNVIDYGPQFGEDDDA
jgi:hypothetical protein